MTKLKLSEKEAISLGARIRATRKALGYKKSTDFQKELGFSPTVYYQWELGRRTPDEESLKKISKQCKINYQWLASGEGSPFLNMNVKKSTADQAEAIIAYELLTNKLANSRKPIPKKLQKSIISLADSAPSAKNPAYIAIQEELMAAILKELLSIYSDMGKKLNPNKIATYSAQIYADIVTAESSPHLQKKLIKAMCNTYRRLI